MSKLMVTMASISTHLMQRSQLPPPARTRQPSENKTMEPPETEALDQRTDQEKNQWIESYKKNAL
jgi:hypothetical protein